MTEAQPNSRAEPLLPNVLKVLSGCFLYAEFQSIFVVFNAPNTTALSGQMLSWLYIGLPLLALANTICCLWVVVKTKKFGWLFVSLFAWLPVAFLVLASSHIGH